MKKNEIIKEIKRLKGEIRKLEKEVNKPEEETIYVPKGILNIQGWILNGNHVLCPDDGSFEIIHNKKGWKKSTEKQYKLVQCERKDLEDGDVAFRTDFQDPNFTKLDSYCIIIDEACQHWKGKSCLPNDLEYDYWYKVVEA